MNTSTEANLREIAVIIREHEEAPGDSVVKDVWTFERLREIYVAGWAAGKAEAAIPVPAKVPPTIDLIPSRYHGTPVRSRRPS